MTAEEYSDGALRLYLSGWHREALDMACLGIEHFPRFAPLHHNHGLVLSALGWTEEAADAYRRSLVFDPYCARTHCNLGVVLCRLGRWRAGYEEMEWRFLTDERLRNLFKTLRHWYGADLRGKRLLVFNDGGHGDLIYFSPLLPRLQERGATVLLAADPEICPLLRDQPGVDQLFPVALRFAEPPGLFPEHDYAVSITSLSQRLGVYCDTQPRPIPYLGPPYPPAYTSRHSCARPRVSITWAGSERHPNDANRSIPLMYFAALGDLPIKLHAVQKGNLKRTWCGEEVNLGIMPADFQLTDLSPNLGNWRNTAYWLCHMDLVISCDTSVAHAAAAMGLPTWLLLPYVHDWRWPAAGERSAWYPTMRIFRQSANRSWPEVLDRVHTELLSCLERPPFLPVPAA